ncbi:MAG TPA: TRAM domain-containing protein [Candidatus Omnitrophota bacterium]|nr:TRAM domain-containing protein [Candidatus Omnitrophota bacterium]HRY85815.1 TRAM domain-containing protein [Candidatus Omnitrophota bacterium]
MILFIRILFVLCCGIFGHYAQWLSGLNLPYGAWISAAAGVLGGSIIVLIDIFFKQYTVRNILSVIAGFALGLLTQRLFMMVLAYANFPEDVNRNFGVATAIIFSYLGIITVLRGQDEFSLMIPFVHLDSKGPSEEMILLDTSVIIDGRIADIANTHFLSSKLILPRFVLKELQLIADSSDPLKRNRGRRGLDVLNAIQSNPNITVKIHELDFPEFNTVDAKLVKMGQVLQAKVFTNDYNLNKVAELQGVKVLNINDLANALKPVVMPGEEMEIKILKEGKEHEQGVAYLDDGTMVVVDNGKRRLGHTVKVTITSVLQTQAGRMIFAKLSDDNGHHGDRGGDRWRENRDRHGNDQRRPRNGHDRQDRHHPPQHQAFQNPQNSQGQEGGR